MTDAENLESYLKAAERKLARSVESDEVAAFMFATMRRKSAGNPAKLRAAVDACLEANQIELPTATELAEPEPRAAAPEPPSAPATRPPRRFWMPDAVFGQGVNAYEFVVYAFLARKAGRSMKCWPSLKTVCKAVGLSRGTVVNAICGLQACGMIERRKRYSASAVYTLTAPDRWRQKSTGRTSVEVHTVN